MTDPASDSVTGDEQWWWDLALARAVPESQRGPDRDVLGPYPSKEAAESWREQHDRREGVWQDQDEEWDGEPEDRDPDG
jgi:hypothetical protein